MSEGRELRSEDKVESGKVWQRRRLHLKDGPLILWATLVGKPILVDPRAKTGEHFTLVS